MDIEEINKWDRYLYKEECNLCGLIQKILTQEDSFPEYYTKVYLQCQCGNFIEFVLPVN